MVEWTSGRGSSWLGSEPQHASFGQAQECIKCVRNADEPHSLTLDPKPPSSSLWLCIHHNLAPNLPVVQRRASNHPALQRNPISPEFSGVSAEERQSSPSDFELSTPGV